MPIPIEYKSLTREFLSPEQVTTQLQLMRNQQANLGVLFDYVEKTRRLVPATGPKSRYGMRETYRARTPIKDPHSSETVDELAVEILVQDLRKQRPGDSLAIAVIQLRAGKNSETYEMLLDAPGSSFLTAKEFMVEGGQVILAHSWWSRMRKCLIKRCATPCTAALALCTGSWAAYLACVAETCGGCWISCGACASCKCKYWCKWAVKCCK